MSVRDIPRARTSRSALTSLLVVCAVPCAAQTSSSDWHWTIAPYSWLAGTGGTIGARDLTVSNSKSIGDILDELKFAAMAVAEGGYSIWSVGLDFMYVSLGNGNVVAVRGDTGTFSLAQKMTMIQPTAMWTVASGTWGGVDVVGGARYWHFKIDLETQLNSRQRNRSSSASIWDGIGGLRVRTVPADRWRVNVSGNLGGGASKLTWEAQGAAFYDFATYWAAFGGYRYLHADFNKPKVRLDGRMSGVLLGVSYRQ